MKSFSAIPAVLVTTALAAAAALIADRLLAPAVAPAAAAAAVVTVVFVTRPIVGLGAFAVFLLLAETFQVWLVTDLLLFDELAILAFVPIAFVRHAIPNRRVRLGAMEVSLLILIAAGVASSLVNLVPPAIWIAAELLLLKAIAFFYIVSWMRIGQDDAMRLGTAIMAVAVVIGALGLVELVDPAAFQSALGLPPYENVRGNVTVVRSIFLHPAQYGWITAFASLFLVARFAVLRSWWALPVALALSVGTVVSGRRTPIIGFVVALAVAGGWQVRQLGTARRVIGVALPILAGVVLVGAVAVAMLGDFYGSTVAQYVPPRQQVAEIFSKEPDALVISTMQPRTALYLSSVAIARDHLPFGVGLGRYGSHLSREDYSPVYEEYGLHRIYLLSPGNPDAVTDTYWAMILGESGVLGLAAALTFFGLVLAAVWRAVDALAGERRAIGLGVLMVFVEGLVRSLTASVYTAPPIAYFLLGAAGLSMAMVSTAAEEAAVSGTDESD